jgi:hypothetical protein
MPGPQEGHTRAGVQRYVLEDFTGGLHSAGVVSRIGLTDTECSCAQDVEFWPVGTVTKRAGRACKNSTTQLSGSIGHVFQWFSPSQASHIMVFTAASAISTTEISAQVMEWNPDSTVDNTWTYVLSSGEQNWNHDVTDPISCATMVGCAFFCNGIDYLMVYDGLTSPAMPVTAAPKGAKCLAFFAGYAFVANCEDIGGGTRHDSRIHWSDPNDPHTWPESQWLDLNVDDGDIITGMAVLGNELIVFKENKIFAVSWVGGEFQFVSELRVDGKGCFAGTSIFPKYSYISFYGADGFYRFDGRTANRYSDKVKDFVVNFTASPRTRIYVTAHESHSQFWHLVPLESSDTFNRLMVYDYDRENWSIWTAEKMSCMTGYVVTSDMTFEDIDEPYNDQTIMWGDRAFQDNTDTIITGSYDGYLYYNSSGTSDASGANASVALTGKWTSRWLDLGMPDINKRVTRVTFIFDREDTVAANAHYIHAKLYTDWDWSTAIATATIPLSSTTDMVLEKRMDMSFTCRTIAVELYTDSYSEPFSLHKVIIEHIPKGRTLV